MTMSLLQLFSSCQGEKKEEGRVSILEIEYILRYVYSSYVHLICAIRDTLNFFLGLSLNFSKIFPSPVSYFVSYFSVNIDTPSLIFSKYFGVT